MIKSEKLINNNNSIVYDISLDGTVVNAFNEVVMSNTDGFNFQLPYTFRYTKENPYIGKGLNRNVVEGKEYTGFDADVAEFNDLFMRGKMGLGIDEVVSSTINFSRKNYADYFPENPYPEDVKLVGNTIKSKKMPEYISKFLSVGIRLLLKNEGQKFLDEYYSYIDKIYNYQIPLKDIATKGKVKKSIKDYIEDCSTVTKAGNPKARQAWMELAIRDGIKVDMGETLYYVNTGKSKSHADVKRIKSYFELDNDGNKKNILPTLEKSYKEYKKKCKTDGIEDILDKKEYISHYFPHVIIEEEITLNCQLLPKEVLDIEGYIDETIEYNVPKYIDMFNKRIKPLIVCFSKEIRDKILITNPDDKPYFTLDQTVLVSGQPDEEGDEDTYEALMSMEDKEIVFWMNHPEFEIPFLEECGMNWDNILDDYQKRKDREKQLGIDKIRSIFEEEVKKMTEEDIDKFSEGILPKKLEKIIMLDPKTYNFVSKEHPDIVIGTIYDILEKDENSGYVEFENMF